MTDNESKFIPPEVIEQPRPAETVEQTQADFRSDPCVEIKDILSGKPYRSISEQALQLLIPQRVRELATNPDKIQVRPIRIEQGEVSILVIEKDYPDQLTDHNAWTKWQEDISTALKAQEGKNFKITPQAPRSVNRLHARFISKIDEGEIRLTDRIIFSAKLKLHPANPAALFVGEFDGETHQGIGQDFYTNTLPPLAKKIGLRYIVGQNNVSNITFFRETLGRYTKEELKPEFQTRLFSESVTNADQNFTIQFLYNEDIEKYIREDKIKPI